MSPLIGRADESGLGYEEFSGPLQSTEDKKRIPEVKFDTDLRGGFTLLSETDYRGTGQFPLEFTRYNVSARSVTSPGCDYRNNMGTLWGHNYSSCILNQLSTVEKIKVCTMGVCITFGKNLKPLRDDLRDTLEKKGVVNGQTYDWVYTQFSSGMREAYDKNGNLLARFNRQGIEHRLDYVDDKLSTVTHVPSGRQLRFTFNPDKSVLVTDPDGQIYKYVLGLKEVVNGVTLYKNQFTFPAALEGSEPLTRTYRPEFINCDTKDNFRFSYLKSVVENGNTLIKNEFLCAGADSRPRFTTIAMAGHNEKNLISERTLRASLADPHELTLKFADSDTDKYRSFVTRKNFDIVSQDTGPYSRIYRAVSTNTRCADCEEDFKKSTYNIKGDLLTRTDFLGRVTRFTYPKGTLNRGLPLTRTEADGTKQERLTTWTWDERFPLKTSEVVGEVAKDWRYDDNGQVIREIVRPATEALVDDSCPATSTTCHQTDYAYVYDNSSHVTLKVSKTGPRAENGSTVTEYRRNGDLWRTTDALGRVSSVLSVNAHGQITEQVDINGVHSVTEYNTLRQPVTESVGDDVTRYSYTTNGRLQSQTRPDGSVLNYSYTPAGSVKTVSLTHGEITDTLEYRRDSRGNILQTIAQRSDDSGQTWKQSFDEKGLLIETADGTGAWDKTLSYDGNNHQTRSCISGEICDLTDYTVLDQISDRSLATLSSKGKLGPKIPLFSLDYDVAGRVTQVVDPVNATSLLTNNELGKHIDEDSPDFGNRGSLYDLAGNEIYREDSDGNSARKHYDALDRLTRVDYSDGGSESQTWDKAPSDDSAHAAHYVGRLVESSRTSAGGLNVTDRMRYDARGNVTHSEQAVTGLPALSTAYEYGPGNRLQAVAYPKGLRIEYAYADGDFRIAQVGASLNGTANTLARDVSYQPLDKRLRSLTFGNGLKYIRSRDNGGRLIVVRMRQANNSDMYNHYLAYDSRNRVTVYDITSFYYDDFDRLVSQKSRASAEKTLLEHDNNGNLTRLENYTASGTLRRTDVLSYSDNRLAREDITPTPPANGSQGYTAAYRYDQSGFITGYGSFAYRYGADRTLITFTQAATSEQYRYDSGRRRVLKTNGAGQTRYVYDTAGRLIYEQAGNGSARNYVWLGDVPLAVVDQKTDGSLAAIYYIETDFANTPRYLRRASGNLSQPVWHWPFAPYGDAAAQEDPDGDGIKVTFNLRYPGQYYDSTTGLHYNHTRYFSPRTGRYLQPDLIGLEGGTNVYTYANGNPVMFTDPTGTSAESSLSQQIGSYLDSALSWFGSTSFPSYYGQFSSLAQDTFQLPGVQMCFMPAMFTPMGIEGKVAKGVGSFASDAKLLSHFEKHGAEFGARSADDYLQVGRDIMQSGQKIEYLYKGETRTGYVQFMGNTSRGDAKFGFVGTSADGAITTIHTQSSNSFWKLLNGNPADKTIRPVP
ncbi:RHS repeat-associated core domain-containing protein [Methylomonas rhizoryzae]|uniref:RHS repeat-associated core domain-containing protein n=1 Tax=Methylomonas rhizoryzae TaxID=2608981 RepID=UPI0016818608|nr:RHS repeat-associated core domain-containing protein [Methylomonas rhizoryzae]